MDVARSVQVGIRTVTEDRLGMAMIDARSVHEQGPAGPRHRSVTGLGAGPVYLTFDIDALDPAFAPGTGTPVWGGLASWQAAAILRDLAGIDLVGGDVVEVAPAYDHGGVTAVAGSPCGDGTALPDALDQEADHVTNQPIGGNDLARFSGPQTFMRLPEAATPEGLDAAIIGVPMDVGTSWRSGARFGPKQIREQSAMLRPYNIQTGAAPFEGLNVADLGDVAINTFSLAETIRIITRSYDRILRHPIVPITLGGDHTLTLPVLRSLAKIHGAVALVHVDAHADVNDQMFGMRETHGTVFRRALEEGLIDPRKTWQIGLRGTGYSAEEFREAAGWGFRIRQAQQLWHQSLKPLAGEIVDSLGDAPVYLSFDIDSLDPAFAPGTGTPEIGGLTTPQAMELIRGLQGLNIVGCDIVEVSPPYDMAGTTALVAAGLVFEMLSILPGVPYR